MTPDELRRRGRAIWQQMPAEVEALTRRNVPLQPVGLVSYAEGETRTLSEVLGKAVLLEREGLLEPGTSRGSLVKMLVARLADHLGDWYGLTEAGAFVDDAAELLEASTDEEALVIVEEISLYAGRVSMWLDLLLPWNELNRVMLSELQGGFGENVRSLVGEKRVLP